MKAFIGTSGYYYKSWIPNYYMNSKMLLEKYSHDFNTVEINSTFYRLPSRNMIKKWGNCCGNNFLFSIKVNKFITHYAKLGNIYQFLKKFFSKFEPIKDKIGCFLFQFPKSFKFNDKTYDRFTTLLLFEKDIRRNHLIHHKTRLVFEFRNRSFFNEEMYNLFKLNKWAFVIPNGVREINILENNKLNLPFFEKFIYCSDILYFRLHGTKGIYFGSYSDNKLKKIANFIKKFKGGFDRAYVYFNNVDRDLEAILDAKKLMINLKQFL